ncbi:HMA2 domain-containing protein [Liquorilactobacillus capillatus]|uniref:Heavy metal translocating P-type ATPase n=1 Tax=Liquorilactobacillus capillatus DSM 19910 TaxID=1423731 RepID=A0A0R1M0T4_9LACO|nr:hypothetical protein [Liquorilactobacillus capillatus]KRL01638.1 hypothetical protein FC81_GL001126 [Liquorilactobacillus capillatus DSM 19910]
MLILHEIPGRIRVYYETLVFSEKNCRRIQTSLSQKEGIIDFRIEPRITTLTVRYDPEILELNEVVRTLLVFQLYNDGEHISKTYVQGQKSFEREVQRSATSGILLATSFGLKLLGYPNVLIDTFATVFTGYTILSHGDRRKGRIHHPDILTAFITSFTLGPKKMTEVALTSWVINVLELINDYQKLHNHQALLQKSI